MDVTERRAHVAQISTHQRPMTDRRGIFALTRVDDQYRADRSTSRRNCRYVTSSQWYCTSPSMLTGLGILKTMESAKVVALHWRTVRCSSKPCVDWAVGSAKNDYEGWPAAEDRFIEHTAHTRTERCRTMINMVKITVRCFASETSIEHSIILPLAPRGQDC